MRSASRWCSLSAFSLIPKAKIRLTVVVAASYDDPPACRGVVRSENARSGWRARPLGSPAMSEEPAQRDRQEGLETPRVGPLRVMEASRRRGSWWRWGLQILGAGIGVALAAWAVSMALGEQSAASRERIAEASVWAIAGLLSLTWAHIVVNGLLFWIALRPLEGAPKTSPVRFVWINTFPTLLAILPFKLSFVTRIALHHRLDGLSFKQLGAWMGAFAALTFGVFIPAGAVGLFADGALWWALFFVAPALGLVGVWVSATVATRVRLLHRLMLGGEKILLDVRALAFTYALRLVDFAILGGRYLLAASVAGVALEPGEALLLASTFFLIGALAPAGALGVAEIGTAFVGTLVGLGEQELALVTLVFSAAHYSGALVMCLPAALVVRPDRVLRGSGPRSAG